VLKVPDKLTNESPIYDYAKRWDRNSSGQRTGRMNYIPLAISRGAQAADIGGNIIDNANLNSALRVITIIATLAAALTLFGATSKNPIGYYTELRWLTCTAAALLVWRGQIQGSLKWAYTLVPISVLFNPIIPIHLHGKHSEILKTWRAVDVVAATVIVLVVILMELQVLLSKKRPS
jgi:hypothetical protein